MTFIRPINNPADKTRERHIADQVARAWGWDLHPFAILDRVDFSAHHRGRTVAMVEVKSNTHPYGTYRYLMVSAHKVIALRDAAHGFHVRPILVIAWTDRTGWVDLDRTPPIDTRWTGREGDPDELCAFLPVGIFRPLTDQP
jgi:hypothetical protein